MTLRRRLILIVIGAGFACALLLPMAAPGLDSIECAAPPYFDALTRVSLPPEPDTGMSALRHKAGLALAELQTRTAGRP